MNVLARLSPGATSLRPFLQRARGVKIGRDVFIGDDVYFDNEYPENIEIHDRVQISIRAVIVAHTRGTGQVIIEREAFVGPHAVIACSAGRKLKIGEGAVISAGCIVTKSVPPHAVLSPAPSHTVGMAEISLPAATSMDEFVSRIRPSKAA